MENLKQCPFCGNKNIFCGTDLEIEYLDEDEDAAAYATGQYAVVCDAQAGGCGATAGYGNTKEIVIQKWNRRAND